jgi:hypothetical protein
VTLFEYAKREYTRLYPEHPWDTAGIPHDLWDVLDVLPGTMAQAIVLGGPGGPVVVMPEAIERVAKALCEGDALSDRWEDTPEDVRESWRESAAGLLGKALPGIEFAEAVGDIDIDIDDSIAHVDGHRVASGTRIAVLKEVEK